MSLLPTYLSLLQRGVILLDTLAKVYEPDMAIDWANRTLMHIGNTRMGLAGRIIKPDLDLEEASIVVGLISRYIDGYWANCMEIPKHDPAKRARVLELHEDLTAAMNEVGAISNVLYEERKLQSQP